MNSLAFFSVFFTYITLIVLYMETVFNVQHVYMYKNTLVTMFGGVWLMTAKLDGKGVLSDFHYNTVIIDLINIHCMIEEIGSLIFRG